MATATVTAAAVTVLASSEQEAEFWQLLLAAELPSAKSRAILSSLGSCRTSGALRDHPRFSDAERARSAEADFDALRRALTVGVQPISFSSFPTPLREASDAPSAIFVWGHNNALHAPCVAIVGTRGASAYGRAAATKFAEALAESGVTVVSGGALGIDTAAHRGALQAGGKTVAVLAGGVDKVYPAINRGLFDLIRGSGCLVSQFAVGAKPNSYKFLARNGLIAALSQAVIVIEAPSRSGSLRTAHAANDLGRQVFVVPATIDMLSFAGSHALIRDGATLVDHPDQVLEAIGVEAAASQAKQAPTSSNGARILGVLSMSPLPPEKIAERTGLDAADVLAELTMLELEGAATRSPGGFVKAL